MSLNGRVSALEGQDGQVLPPMTEAERAQRLQAMLDLYEARDWRPSGNPEEDQRVATLLYVLLRAAERAAWEDPTPEALAEAELWRERQALFKAAA